MFYTDSPSNFLRMGDIVEGYVSAVPEIKEPIKNSFIDYKVTVELPKLLVIITPCCSIGDKKVSVVPLEEVRKRKSLFEVPYLRADMTNINRIMEPEKSLSSENWKKLKPDEKIAIQNRPIEYAFEPLFVYAEHDKLPKYTVRLRGGDKIKSGYYMIDFRKASRMKCDCIISPENENAFTDEIQEKLLDSRKLELSIDTREELRKKIAYYYRRVPKEDKVD